MKSFDCVLIATHIAYKKDELQSPIEGPYSAIAKSVAKVIKSVFVLGLPLLGYEGGILWGKEMKVRKIKFLTFLGKWLPVKFAVDIVLTIVVAIMWSLKNWGKKKLIIGIDPLSCLPLLLFKKVLGYTLVFHCVDFNKNRFNNKALQKFYELADEWASRYSDQTWVICDALKRYKKRQFGVDSHYLPNSVVFDEKVFFDGKKLRSGKKMVWTGSLMTDRQFDILFKVFSYIQTEVRADMEFVVAPTRDMDKFELYIKKYKIKNIQVLSLSSRSEFQTVAAKCDVGIALYDEQFGSTEFIEPMKIWDFLLCGLPFIVSCEPSVSKPITESGVAFFMNPKNTVPNLDSIKNFLDDKNLSKLSTICLKLAKKFDINRQIKMLLSNIK